MKLLIRVLPIAAFVLLAGCVEYTDPQSTAPGFGDAVRRNNAVMIANPNPAGAADTNIDLNGDRAGLAFYRYRTGTVIQPVPLRTTTNVISGGTGMSSQ